MLDLDRIEFRNLEFSDSEVAQQGNADGFPALSAGVTTICGSWEYDGMAAGMNWNSIWYIDGKRSIKRTAMNQDWTGAESGRQSICIENEAGFTDGMYELLLSVEGVLQVAETAFVGSTVPTTFSVLNDSRSTICGVYLSPSDAYDFGQNKLGEGGRLSPGEAKEFVLPSGFYDVGLEDCQGEVLDRRFGLNATTGYAFTFGQSSAQ